MIRQHKHNFLSNQSFCISYVEIVYSDPTTRPGLGGGGGGGAGGGGGRRGRGAEGAGGGGGGAAAFQGS